MALAQPRYITKAGLANTPITYKWDDADSVSMYLPDRRLANRIAQICPTGIVALTAGFAEWIAWRLVDLTNDRILLNYIEAAWAGLVDWSYLKSPDEVRESPNLQDWTGPARGPVCVAFNYLDEVINGTKRHRSTSLSSSCLGELALHVMADRVVYKEWRRFAVQRLTHLYPKDANDLGPPLPREVLDPDFDYRPESATGLLRSFLGQLDYNANPFLNSPEEMSAKGYKGVPYIIGA